MTTALRACVIVGLALGAACGGSAPQESPSAGRAVLSSADAKGPVDDGPDCTPVPTPNGPWPVACVHEVPNFATVTPQEDGTTVVTLDGQVVATYPPCPCPTSGALRPASP